MPKDIVPEIDNRKPSLRRKKRKIGFFNERRGDIGRRKNDIVSCPLILSPENKLVF